MQVAGNLGEALSKGETSKNSSASSRTQTANQTMAGSRTPQPSLSAINSKPNSQSFVASAALGNYEAEEQNLYKSLEDGEFSADP